MEKINQVIEFVKAEAEKFGAKQENYVFRNNTKDDAFANGGAYFGLINSEEEVSGPYHDLSIVIMPDNGNQSWLVALGIGSLGFKNDFELASYPGTKRLFYNLVDENGFCKNSLLDIETNLPKSFTEKLLHIKKTIQTYQKVLPICQIIEDPLNIEGKQRLSAFLAAYAEIREWASNKSHREAINKALFVFNKNMEIDDESQVLDILRQRKFVVLEGAPGTGKTRLAKIITHNLNAKVFFTQFHAETTYSDFIYGIKPKLNDNNLKYEEQKGIFYKALEYAMNTKEPVVLIIDEINRANLSNVLGPIFYLFEYKQDDSSVKVNIGGNFDIDKIPDNFHVIATMNTADRSLAVVDFALRRRFAWYPLIPKPVECSDFCVKDFNEFNKIFNKFASNEELALQPGQGYFFASSDEEMKNRIRYELFPLIKEYLAEGILLKAKEEFSKYFFDRIEEILEK